MAADARTPVDQRVFDFRHLETVYGLPDWGGSLEAWRKRRERIRATLELAASRSDAVCEWKPRAEVVTSHTCGDVVVENVSVETLPGLYVQANVAKRDGAEGRLPVMLNVHGHGQNARTTVRKGGASSVPHTLVNFALQGFLSVSWSMIGFDDDSRQIDHRALLVGGDKRRDNLWGFGLFPLQTNNSIKMLDYVCARDDADAGRVGCNGASGGGTQTYFLAALDERVKAAAPVVMLSGHFQGGCVCENHPDLRQEFSNIDFAGLIAPRALMLCGCSGDWTHHTLEREYASLRELYALYGVEDRMWSHMIDEEHNYNQATREAVYAFMQRALVDEGFTPKRIPEADHPVPPREALLVYDTPVPPRDGAIDDAKKAFAMWRGVAPAGRDTPALWRELGGERPGAGDVLVRRMTPMYRLSEKLDLGAHRIECGRFSTSSSVPCNVALPREGGHLVVWVDAWDDGEGRAAFCKEPPEGVRLLLEDGYGIVVPSLFLQDASDEMKAAWRERADSYLFTTYNRTEHWYQMQDVMTVIAMAAHELGIPTEHVLVAATERMAPLAFVAWALAGDDTGPFVADFGGADLSAEDTWAERAYFPYALQCGGIAGVSRAHCGGRRGVVSAVRAPDRASFPEGFEVREASASLEDLIRAATR